MYRYIALAVVSAELAVSMPVMSGATLAIGVAMSDGAIFVNGIRTPGNTTILDGTTLQTQRVSSQVRLKHGAQVRFDSDSRGKLFSDHVDLQQGTARISAYSAVARGLSVRAGEDSSASVSVRGNAIQVAALKGDVHVFNAAGMNVANLFPGRALDLRAQDAGASSRSSLTGCPVKLGDNYLLTDETSNVTAQLRGGKITNRKRIQVTGSLVPNATPVSPATQVIAVNSVKEVSGSCANFSRVGAAGNPVGAGPGSSGAAGAAGAGAGDAANNAVILGVAMAAGAGAAIGGAAAAGAFNAVPPVTCTPTSAQPCPI